MTARELFDLIEGLPTEALCGTIHYSPNHLAWFRDGADKHRDMSGMSDAHAEALQRDAMTEWLLIQQYELSTDVFRYPSGEWMMVPATTKGSRHETRTHALAAAVRYVSGHADSSPSSS